MHFLLHRFSTSAEPLLLAARLLALLLLARLGSVSGFKLTLAVQFTAEVENQTQAPKASDWLVSTVPSFRPRIRGQHVDTSRPARDEA